MAVIVRDTIVLFAKSLQYGVRCKSDSSEDWGVRTCSSIFGTAFSSLRGGHTDLIAGCRSSCWNPNRRLSTFLQLASSRCECANTGLPMERWLTKVIKESNYCTPPLESPSKRRGSERNANAKSGGMQSKHFSVPGPPANYRIIILLATPNLLLYCSSMSVIHRRSRVCFNGVYEWWGGSCTAHLQLAKEPLSCSEFHYWNYKHAYLRFWTQGNA